MLEIDTLLGGWERVTAGYLITGPAPVLVGTGRQTSVPTLLAALDDLGIGLGELAGIVVTHITSTTPAGWATPAASRRPPCTSTTAPGTS